MNLSSYLCVDLTPENTMYWNGYCFYFNIHSLLVIIKQLSRVNLNWFLFPQGLGNLLLFALASCGVLAGSLLTVYSKIWVCTLCSHKMAMVDQVLSQTCIRPLQLLSSPWYDLHMSCSSILIAIKINLRCCVSSHIYELNRFPFSGYRCIFVVFSQLSLKLFIWVIYRCWSYN